jgi:hypothetical protein
MEKSNSVSNLVLVWIALSGAGSIMLFATGALFYTAFYLI